MIFVIAVLLRMLGAPLLIAGSVIAALSTLAPDLWIRMLTSHGYTAEWQLHPPLLIALAIAGAGLAAIIASKSGSMGKPKLSESDSHGSARKATTAELRAAGHGKDRGVVLCQEDTAKLSVQLDSEGDPYFKVLAARAFIRVKKLHTLVVGATGTGKDEGVLLPTLLSCIRRSCVVLDPKGMAFKWTAGYRSVYTNIFRFAPVESGGDRCNPLLTVRVGKLEESTDAENIANVLCTAAKDERDSSYFYSESGQPLLAAAILYVLHNKTGKDRSLPGVARLLGGAMRQKDVVDLICKGLPASADLLRAALTRMLDDGKTIVSAFTTCTNALKFCRMPTVADAISGSDFKPSDLSTRETPTTLYLVIPFKDAPVLRPLARLMLNMLLNHHGMERTFDTTYHLNEADSLGNVPALVNGIGQVREYGVQIVIYVQSLAQLFKNFGDHGALTIVENCQAHVIMGVSGLKASEDVSAMFGKMTLVRERRTQAISRKSLLEQTTTNTRGEGEQAREFLTSDEARALAADNVIVFLPNLRPYIGKRVVRLAMKSLQDRALIPAPSLRRPA